MTKLRTDKVIQVENNRHVIVPDLDRLEARTGN
jgi:CRP/FNR family transcriptional regulator